MNPGDSGDAGGSSNSVMHDSWSGFVLVNQFLYAIIAVDVPLCTRAWVLCIWLVRLQVSYLASC